MHLKLKYHAIATYFPILGLEITLT